MTHSVPRRATENAKTMPSTGTVSERAPGGVQRDARALLDAAMSEAEWQQVVIEAAVRAHWQIHHQLIPFRRGKDGKPRAIVEPGVTRGFPDLVCVHEARQELIYLELKTEKGKLTPEQERWRDLLQGAGARWYCIRPHDWPLVCRVLGIEEG